MFHVQLLHKRFHAKNLGAGENRRHRHAKDAVQVEALPRQQQVVYRRTRRKYRGHRVVEVLADAVGRTLARKRVTPVRQRRAGKHALDGAAQVGQASLHQAQALLHFGVFELHIRLAPVANRIFGPTHHIVPAHRREQIELRGVSRAVFRHGIIDQHALGAPRIDMPQVGIATMYENIAVQVRHRVGFQADVGREHAERIWQTGNAVAVDVAQTRALAHQCQRQSRMRTRHHPVGWQRFAAVHHHFRYFAVGFDQASYRGVRAHRAAKRPDAVGQPVGYERAAAAKPPRALDERVVDLGEDVERQRFGVQFHFERRAGKHLAQQRVGHGFVQKLVGRPRKKRCGVKLVAVARREAIGQMLAHLAQKFGVFLQVPAFFREKLGQTLRKPFVAVGERERTAVHHHFVEAVGVHAPPRQVEQAEILEQAVQRLPFVQAADVVETSVERGRAAPERLQATANVRVVFKHGYLVAVLGQDVAALQAAQAASYDNDFFQWLRAAAENGSANIRHFAHTAKGVEMRQSGELTNDEIA